MASAKGNSGSLKAGYLMKRGEINKGWKVRWCRVCDSNLLYYKTPEQTKAVGSIPLAHAVVRFTRPNPANQGPSQPGTAEADFEEFAFEIVTKQRIFYMAAKSQQEMLEWVKILASHTRLHAENELIEQAEEMIYKAAGDVSNRAEKEMRERRTRRRRQRTAYSSSRTASTVENLGVSKRLSSRPREAKRSTSSESIKDIMTVHSPPDTYTAGIHEKLKSKLENLNEKERNTVMLDKSNSEDDALLKSGEEKLTRKSSLSMHRANDNSKATTNSLENNDSKSVFGGLDENEEPIGNVNEMKLTEAAPAVNIDTINGGDSEEEVEVQQLDLSPRISLRFHSPPEFPAPPPPPQ